MEKFLLVDGNSLLNRAFYALPVLSTASGEYTNAVYGFFNMLFSMLDRLKPEYAAVAFDRKEPTFRHKQFTEYKAGRKPMPDELIPQFPLLKSALEEINIPFIEMPGFEADDLLGTLSLSGELAGLECCVLSGDRDVLQLVSDKTTVYLTKKGISELETYTPDYLKEKMGLEPEQIIELKALMGDSSDNIPGVPGIGEKTAMALVQQYGSIDAVYANIDSVPLKPVFLCKLKEGEASARHSYWLATIVTDAPLEFRPEDNLRQPFKPELYDLFLRLEFQKLIDKYGLSPQHQPEEKADAAAEVEILETAERARELVDLWRGADHVTVYGLPDFSALAVACETGEGTVRMAELYENRYGGNWHDLLEALFAADVKKVGHNVKDMIRALLERELPAEGFVFDTALAAYLCDATAGSYDIAKLFLSFYNEELPKPAHLEPEAFTSLLGDDTAAQTALISYTSAVSALHGTLAAKLEALDVTRLYYEVELPLCRVLAEMETAGFLVDRKALAEYGQTLQGVMDETEQAIYAAAGETFNINSPKQLGVILFEKLGLPHGKKTKTGWSTNADVLEKLRYDAPIVADVLRYRQYAKLKSTYVDGLMKVIEPDGRVRTSFQMTVTATGRLSSTEPNLQNIPTRTELGSQLRRMFTAPEGCVLVDADYSQIELRLLAHIAGDTEMQAAFRSGEDFHTVTASRVFHVEPQEVTPEMRRRAKAVNFGIVYGISAFSLAQDIGVSVAEAKAYMERYFETYQGVRQYMTDVVAKAERDGYVQTLMHRRRALPELKSSNFNVRQGPFPYTGYFAHIAPLR